MNTANLDPDGFYYRLEECTDPIRIAKQISKDGRRRYKGFNTFSEVSDFVRKNEHLSLHEVTRCGDKNGGNQRIFLDIDAKQEDFPDMSTETLEYACKILIQSAQEVIYGNSLLQLPRSEIIDTEHTILISHRPGKFSKHIVFNNVYIDVNHYKCFYNDLAATFAFNLNGEKLPSELIGMIDAGVYDTHHCLRLHTSTKYGCDVRLRKEGSDEKFDVETMVTFVPQDMFNRPKLQFYKCAAGCPGPVKPKYDTIVSEDHLKVAEQILDSMQDEGISVAKMGSPFIRLNVDHSKPCPVCGAKHDNENIMAVVNTEVLRLICRRKQKGEENRSRVIHTFGRYVEDIPTPVEEIKSIKTIKTHSDSLGEIDEQISKCDRLFIRSDMGSRKSTRVHEYIARQIEINPDFCCVFLTYRVNLASSILAAANKFNPNTTNSFEKYDEIASNKISLNDHSKIIIQLESLGRLDYDLADDKRIDLVVIDEAVSFCQQNLSGLNKKMNAKNQMMLRNLLKNSEKTIIMDALLDTPTIEAYQCLLPKDEQVLWINEAVTMWAPQIEDFRDAVKWRRQLSDALISGQKIYVAVTNGEKSIKQLERYLLKRKRDLNILTIYGGGENNEFIVSNINRELVKYDCVIASPCMSAGISFDVKNYFDAVYAFIDNKGPTAIDIIQSLRRVRNTKTNTLVLCNLCNKVQLPTSYKDIFDDEQKRLKFNSWDYINDGFSLELNKNNVYFKHPDDDGLRWKLHCIRIANLNKIDRYETVIKYLKSKGATLVKLVNKDEETNLIKQERKEFVNEGTEIKKENAVKIAKTSLITEKEYESLRSRGKKYIDINNEKPAGVTETDNDLMKKFQLLRHYGLHEDLFAEDNKKVRTDPFNNPSFVEKYSKREVMECYKNIIYRDLTNEQVKEIDDNNAAKLTADVDKIDHEYLFGRHVTINKIKDLFTIGTVESAVLVNYVSEIHKLGNPLLTRYREINEKTVMNAVNKIISPYGYKIGSTRIRNGDIIKRVYLWKDYTDDLFVIKRLPLYSDDLTILAFKQSGTSEKPVAIIYEK